MLTIIENLLSDEEVETLLGKLTDGDWANGAQTAGTRSVAVKQNLQLGVTDPLARELGNVILSRLGRSPEFISASLAEKIFPPVFNLYQNGGHYGCHVDSALMRVPDADMTIRSDVSATIYLSSPDDYDGGELVIETEYGAQEVKLAAGDMVLYPSNSLHQVMPVTRGQRICAITWIQSAVADASARAMLYDMDTSIQALSSGRSGTDPDIERLIHVYHNLLRRWASV
jgi:PKHD-type hydroxylase